MKYLLIFQFLLCSLNSVSSRSLFVINEGSIPIEFIAWKDSKIIHHHIMPPGTKLKINEIGSGVLIQYKFVGYVPSDNFTPSPGCCQHQKVLNNGFMEFLANKEHLSQHENWLESFGPFTIHFKFHIEIDHSNRA